MCAIDARPPSHSIVPRQPRPKNSRDWLSKCRRLRDRARELEIAPALAASNSAANEQVAGVTDTSPLLVTHGIRARVLGSRAAAVLSEAQIIAVGRKARPLGDALVLADSAISIDGGQDARIADGDLALAGRRIYGKVIDVGLHTATVRRADQPGYRDVVQLARLTGGRLALGAKGVLEGTGDCTCRVRLVSAHESVEPGDLVLTAHNEGLLPQALVYGVVRRAERRVAAPHWDISVELAGSAANPTHLIVLRTELDRERLAAAPAEPGQSE